MDDDLVFALLGVEMRRRVLSKIHRDDDSQEPTDLGQGVLRLRSVEGSASAAPEPEKPNRLRSGRQTREPGETDEQDRQKSRSRRGLLTDSRAPSPESASLSRGRHRFRPRPSNQVQSCNPSSSDSTQPRSRPGTRRKPRGQRKRLGTSTAAVGSDWKL